jgi:ABC-type multidrug transport system ATPase subunit
MELIISNLAKTYANGVQALKNISLNVKNGMFGLLGPNGAGKSTLMRIVATLQEADSGTIRLGDIDVLQDKDAVRRLLGYLPQEFGLDPHVVVGDLLEHFAALKGVPRAERKDIVMALLQQTNLVEHRHKKLGTLSGGMKQRFGIAQCLLGNPRLIIVDEPTAGLDPAERNRFHNLLSEIGENVIVILSTHIIEDVSDLCDQMAVIFKGHLLLAQAPQAAIDAIQGQIWQMKIEKSELMAAQKQYPLISSRLYGGKVLIRAVAPDQPASGFKAVEPTLEDVYFSTIKNFAAGA